MAISSDAAATALRPTPPHILSLLSRLHSESTALETSIAPATMQSIRAQYATDVASAQRAMDDLMLHQPIALDADKAQFMYNLILSTGARNIVEIGTSFGVSTIYLALGVLQNLQRYGGSGVVVGTEKEANKAAVARANWKQAGQEVEGVIKLVVGDLTQTLADSSNWPGEPIDLVLMDIWPYVALPALKLLLPHLKPGAIILTDNVTLSKEGYAEYLAALHDPHGPFNNVLLPFTGGFQMSVYYP